MAAVMLPGAPSQAQGLTEQQLIEALSSQATRGIRSAPAAPATGATDARMLELLKGLEEKGTRGFSVKERSELADIAAGMPSIDFEVLFDFNSAVIKPEAKQTLDVVGRALSSSSLAGGTYLLAGHTDAKGRPHINLAISHARAQAVRDYLVKEYRIGKDHLYAIGFGEERLKNTRDPNAAENRRVQIVTTRTKEAKTK